MQAVNRLMNDIQSRPVEDLICSFGTIFGSRYYTVEPIGGNWLEMETWCTETFEPVHSIWQDYNTAIGRWYMNDRKFWFKTEKDREWFILRWS